MNSRAIVAVAAVAALAAAAAATAAGSVPPRAFSGMPGWATPDEHTPLRESVLSTPYQAAGCCATGTNSTYFVSVISPGDNSSSTHRQLTHEVVLVDRTNRRVFLQANITSGDTGEVVTADIWMVPSGGGYRQITYVSTYPGNCYVQSIPKPDSLQPFCVGGPVAKSVYVGSAKSDVRHSNSSDGLSGQAVVTESLTCKPIELFQWAATPNAGAADGAGTTYTVDFVKFSFYDFFGQIFDATAFGLQPNPSNCVNVTSAEGGAAPGVLSALARIPVLV